MIYGFLQAKRDPLLWLKGLGLRPICRSEDQKIKIMMTVLLQRALEPHYIYKVDEKTDVDTDVDLKLLPHSYLIDIEYKAMEG